MRQPPLVEGAPQPAQSLHRTVANGESHGRGMVEWLTPPYLLKWLGDFDLDPCAPIIRPWDTARRHLTILEDGLSREWNGRVWLNPPYDGHAGRWIARLAEHGNGIALLFARTETDAFFKHVWPTADALLFLKGRLRFHRVDGSLPTHSNCGAPSVLVAYGHLNAGVLFANADRGAFVNGQGISMEGRNGHAA